MAGLAAGIRLGMYDKKVLILEKHLIPGGLNSYYQRRNFDSGGLRHFDVGLHALTNYIKKGEKAKPFSKLLKQLRLSYDDFKLHPQSYSVVQFGQTKLTFTNEFNHYYQEIVSQFPLEKNGLDFLLEKIKSHDELKLESGYVSSRSVLDQFLKDPLLKEMLLAPLLIYGSAWENDMDFSQFVIMFKSIYQEGFSRPEGGVRTIIKLLMAKLDELKVEIKFKTPVLEIIQKDGVAIGVRTQDGEYFSKQIFSSAGLPETMMLAKSEHETPKVGKLSFVESLFVTKKKLAVQDFAPTIVFYNKGAAYAYEKPKTLFDPKSAVVCFPDHYELENKTGEGMIRVTHMANFDLISELKKEDYLLFKKTVEENALSIIKEVCPSFNEEIVFTDTFTPLTIKKFTSHFEGVVYGSEDKLKDGVTSCKNLFIIGTDQGFLGIVGALLSGVSMANLHGLMESPT